jgi:hypothetical protein
MSVEGLTSRSRLESIDVVRIDLQRAHAVPFGLLPVVAQLHLAMRSNVRIPNTLHPEGFAVLAEVELDWHDDDNTPVAALGLTLRLSYTLTEVAAFDGDVVMRFATQVAMHQAWPFLRERVRSLSCEMGLPPLLLPLRHLGNVGHSTAEISGTVRVDDPRLR